MVRTISAERDRTVLFLFNFTTRSLRGIFMASGEAGFPLFERAWVPGAWSDKLGELPSKRAAVGGSRTPYPAQLPIQRLGPELPPLPESVFGECVQYEGSTHKFSYTLDAAQVERLVTLFIEYAKRARPKAS
eukprot:5335621-Prymnesium_polylepis.1